MVVKIGLRCTFFYMGAVLSKNLQKIRKPQVAFPSPSALLLIVNLGQGFCRGVPNDPHVSSDGTMGRKTNYIQNDV